MRCLAIAILVASNAAGAAAPHAPCGTPARLAKLGVPHALPAKQLQAGAMKWVRDPFPGQHQRLTSANFAVQWLDPAVTQEDAQRVLDAAEEGYALYVGGFAQQPPAGSSDYLINIYLSASASDSPAIDFAGGYAWVDDDAYPYVVMSTQILGDLDVLRDVTVHELYHDFQLSTGAFANSYWYWEATAEWAAQEVLPDTSYAYTFVGAYSLAEELPLFYFGDALGNDPVLGVHQYGAGSFPRYLTEALHDRTLVPHTWSSGAADDDPLTVLLSLVALDEVDVADRFGEFAEHQVLYDEPHGELMQAWAELYAMAYPERPRMDAKVDASGAPDWTTPSVLPHAFGFDIIEIKRPAGGALHIDLATDAKGSAGTKVLWRASLVERTPDGITYTPVASAFDTQLPPYATTVWLVVSATADTRDADETFGFEFRVNPPPDPGSDPMPMPDEPDGGWCAASSSPSGVFPVVLALLIGTRGSRRRVRRRRDTARQDAASHRIDDTVRR